MLTNGYDFLFYLHGVLNHLKWLNFCEFLPCTDTMWYLFWRCIANGIFSLFVKADYLFMCGLHCKKRSCWKIKARRKMNSRKNVMWVCISFFFFTFIVPYFRFQIVIALLSLISKWKGDSIFEATPLYHFLFAPCPSLTLLAWSTVCTLHFKKNFTWSESLSWFPYEF